MCGAPLPREGARSLATSTREPYTNDGCGCAQCAMSNVRKTEVDRSNLPYLWSEVSVDRSKSLRTRRRLAPRTVCKQQSLHAYDYTSYVRRASVARESTYSGVGLSPFFLR